MDYLIRVSVFLLGILAAAMGQLPPPSRPSLSRILPKGLNANRLPSNPFLPASGLVPLSPGGLGKTYCPLSFQQPFRDPAILDATAAEVAEARARAQSRLSSDERLYLSAKRQQNAARDARRNADGRGGGQGVAPPRGASAGKGRSKRQVDVAVLAPTNKKSVCRSVEKTIRSVMSEAGHVCYLFEEDEVNYWECATNHASFPKSEIQFQRYYCESDNYVFQSVLSFCPSQNATEWVTMYIPISCCSKHYSCDFTPYSSANGPKRFEG